jgi:hypothetical protein
MPISRDDVRTYCKDVFPEYGWALLAHVWVVVFCVLAAILGVVAVFINIPSWVWAVTALSGVLISQFLAWDSMRKERNQLRRYDITQGTLAQLSEFRGQLIAMQNETLSRNQNLVLGGSGTRI